MKALLLSLLSCCIINVALSQKTVTQEVLLDSDTYKELKESGELTSGNYNIINPNEGVSTHVTVHPSMAGERDGECDCWLEPDGTYTETTFAANGTDDGSTPNIAFPFDFELYGTTYNSFWINTNGTVTFDGADGTFTPTGFPNNDVMLAPFWGDVDFGCANCGSAWYKVTDDAVYVNWLQVGYFNEQSDKLNTFQVVFTPSDSDVLGGGNNAQFCYQDMQWTTGGASGGTSGFGGSPANVGASAGNNVDFILFGEFDQEGSDYDGPFDTTDGVSWLDNQTITFNANISANDNLPPLVLGETGCDTIVLCANDVDNLEYTFLAPEDGQNISLSVDDGGFPGIGLAVTEGATATATVTLESGLDAGEYDIVLTATDDGTPPASTSINIFVQVLDIVVPDLEITSDGLLVDTLSYCQGVDGVPLEASTGFDSLLWSNNYPLEEGTFTQGSYTVTGFFDQCDTEAGPVVIFQIPVFSPDWSATELLLCNGDSSVITFDDADEFPDYTWTTPTGLGEILSEDEENNSITVTPGLYGVSVVDENGCTGASFIPINEEILNLQQANFPQPQCDDNTVTWTGSWANPNECPMVIFLYDSDADTWEGGFIEAFVDGAGPFIFSINNAAPLLPTGQDLFHGQTIEFFWNPGIDDDDVRVQFFEPGDNTVEIFDTDDGDQLLDGEEPFFTFTADCGYNALPGTWSANPDVGTFSHPNEYNPVDANQTYTAPEDFLGTVTLTFESDICEIVDEFDITFSTTPVISVTSDTVCGDEQATLELTIEPAALLDTDINIDWSPNGSPNADGELVANFNNSADVTVSVSNFCGSPEASGTAVILPIPDPQLVGSTICEGTSFTLNPGSSHPSFSYDWTNGADTETISVTDAGNYGVTISNECGTETSNVTLSVTPVPLVNFWASDTLICEGEEIIVNPLWSGIPAEGPISWFLTFTDEMDNVQIVPYESTETSFILGADMLPADPINDAFLTYTYSNVCGTAQGSVAADVQSCFVGAYNVISPDSDGSEAAAFGTGGLNEGWQIVGIDGVPNVDVQIFDRWGGLVYESSNYSNLNPWKGEDMNGNELSDGVYFYTVYVPRGDKDLTGTVTILRKL
ncbi:MAG: nidogen-like domain-containing protein [Flavobacteriales bacterium]